MGEQAELWEQVVRKLRGRVMPPSRQVTCKDCYLTRGEEAHYRHTQALEFQADRELVAALWNAK